MRGILISGQLAGGRYNLHHLGRRRSKPYLLKQFYSIDINAFLRWQNEARFIAIPQTEGFNWPCEEWRGGTISPFPEGKPLDTWLTQGRHSLDERLNIAAHITNRISVLHMSGVAHRGLSPTNIRIGNQAVTVVDFGHSHCRGWDDFWIDTIRPPVHTAFAAPENLSGDPCGCEADIYGLGVLLYLLLSEKTAFGPIKRTLRPTLPNYILPNELPSDCKAPSSIRTMVSACLERIPSNRPSIAEIVGTLSDHCEHGETPDIQINIPSKESSLTNKERIMVFLKDTTQMASQFDTALEKAEDSSSVFLFVGLIPNNLPSGHTERFKGSMIKKLASGLMRCREQGLEWSLRIFENVDQFAAETLLRNQYEPDISF